MVDNVDSQCDFESSNEDVEMCADGVQDLSLLEKQKISVCYFIFIIVVIRLKFQVFVKLIGHYGKERIVEINDLVQSDVVKTLKANVLETLRQRGFVYLAILEVSDLIIGESLTDEDYLTANHVYQLCIETKDFRPKVSLYYYNIFMFNQLLLDGGYCCYC